MELNLGSNIKLETEGIPNFPGRIVETIACPSKNSDKKIYNYNEKNRVN